MKKKPVLESVFDITEIIAIDFTDLFLKPGERFAGQDEWSWYSLIDKDLHDRNFAVICFEKASCWDSETKRNYYIKLPNGKNCKSDLRMVTKSDYNVSSSK